MAKAISDTSPLVYLYRIGGLDWLPVLFEDVWVPSAVVQELATGRTLGYDVPDPTKYAWLRLVDPHAVPSEWLVADLGAGEIATLALAFEHPEHILLLDDLLARRIAQAAGLTVWGTLRLLLEAKSHGLIERVAPQLDALERAGLWMSQEIKHRILRLAHE